MTAERASLDELAADLTPEEIEGVRVVIRAASAGLLPDLGQLVAQGPDEAVREARRRMEEHRRG